MLLKPLKLGQLFSKGQIRGKMKEEKERPFQAFFSFWKAKNYKEVIIVGP